MIKWYQFYCAAKTVKLQFWVDWYLNFLLDRKRLSPRGDNGSVGSIFYYSWFEEELNEFINNCFCKGSFELLVPWIDRFLDKDVVVCIGIVFYLSFI